jgi:hypothetical protein
MHDRIIKQVIKRRFQSSGIHDNLQNGMMGLWIPFETFPSVVHGDMRIKADAMLSGCRSCLVTVRDLPADHDEPLTPERHLRRNPVGHKQSAKPDWSLSSFRSLRLTSPIQRPFHQKVDQPVAPVIVPLDASGHPNHPGAVGRLDRDQHPAARFRILSSHARSSGQIATPVPSPRLDSKRPWLRAASHVAEQRSAWLCTLI